MIIILLIPLNLALPYTSQSLKYFGVNSIAADLTAQYMTVFFPGLVLNALLDAVDIYLLGMGKTYVIMWM